MERIDLTWVDQFERNFATNVGTHGKLDSPREASLVQLVFPPSVDKFFGNLSTGVDNILRNYEICRSKNTSIVSNNP